MSCKEMPYFGLRVVCLFEARAPNLTQDTLVSVFPGSQMKKAGTGSLYFMVTINTSNTLYCLLIYIAVINVLYNIMYNNTYNNFKMPVYDLCCTTRQCIYAVR